MSPDKLRALGVHIAEQQDPVLEAERLDARVQEQIRRRLVERVRQRSARMLPGRLLQHGWAVAGAVVVVLAGLGLTRVLRSGEESLRFTVGLERHGTLQALEAAPENAELPLSFSDGSVVDLAPGARARVAELRADGADIVLESGKARVDVVPRRAGRPAHWRLRSGPFAVRVKGTSFWLRWDPGTAAFSLDLLAGEVFVTGCGLGAGRAIHAGERIEASCRSAEAADAPTTPTPLAEQLERASSTAHPFEVDKLAPPGRSAAPRRPPPARAERNSWQRVARDGDFARAYELASDRDWDSRLAAATPDDLLLLAQTARVTGHQDEARRAYAAVRRRFAGTAAAARAAFGLGVLAFDTSPKNAGEWFETYINEQPGGALAGAALDRLFEAAVKVEDLAKQRRVAKRYIEENGSGPHAAEARRVLAGSAGNE